MDVPIPVQPSRAVAFSEFNPSELKALLALMHDSLRVRRHQELFQWLRGGVQEFIPHDILVTAWGDFNLGLVYSNVVSCLPGVRTKEINRDDFRPLLLRLFRMWTESERMPLVLPLGDARHESPISSRETALNQALKSMRSAMVQGIKDERGRHDCLYVAMSGNPTFDARASRAMSLLLPYIDTALRQVSHLPIQYGEHSEQAGGAPSGETPVTPTAQINEFERALSEREREILHWVCLGKTNQEISLILDISYFTVKNHLQRIFRKLDVLNRAQAVSKLSTSNSLSVKRPKK